MVRRTDYGQAARDRSTIGYCTSELGGAYYFDASVPAAPQPSGRSSKQYDVRFGAVASGHRSIVLQAVRRKAYTVSQTDHFSSAHWGDGNRNLRPPAEPL